MPISYTSVYNVPGNLKLHPKTGLCPGAMHRVLHYDWKLDT